MDAVTAMLDIVKNFSVISSVEMIKITSTKQGARAETTDGQISPAAFFSAAAGGSASGSPLATVNCYCELHHPIEDFVGTIGLGTLSVLKGFDAFQKDAQKTLIEESRGTVSAPIEIKFDYANRGVAWYRLTSSAMISKQLQVPQFRGATFDVTLRPDAKSIRLLNHFSKDAAKTGKLQFWPNMNTRGKLYFSFDERKPTNSTARFEFGAQLPFVELAPYLYPAKPVAEVLTLAATSESLTMRFSNMGILQIDVVSTLGNYHFIFPGSDQLIWAWEKADDWPHVHGVKQKMLDDRVMHHDWMPDLD